MAMTYEEALRRIGRRISVQIDKVRGTEIRRAPGEAGEHGDIQVRYRGTPVVTLHPDHTYTLRTGGTYSKTTIRRIAEYSPVALTRERNGVFIEDPERGRYVPFLEGLTVDQQGHIVTSAQLVKLPAPDGKRGHQAHSAGPTWDEETLRAFIRQVVMETLGDMAIAPGRQMPGQGRGRKVVDVKATAAPKADTTLIPLDVIEKLFRSQLPPDKAKRAILDLTSAYARGRKPKAEVKEGADPSAAAASRALCNDCKEPLIAHYDRANRWRGCDYALKHIGETVDLT